MENKNKGGKKSKLVRLNNSQLSFLKRRFNLFKKANELSTRCGIEVAVMLVLQNNPSVDELSEKVTMVKHLVKIEKKRNKALRKVMEARKNEALFGASIEEISLEQLKELKAKLMVALRWLMVFNHGEGPNSV
ncbi:hypothetical protein ACSBR2_019094 [Camellia fascicularis]